MFFPVIFHPPVVRGILHSYFLLTGLQYFYLAFREEGEWENLPQNERQRNETSLVHIGMTAR